MFNIQAVSMSSLFTATSFNSPYNRHVIELFTILKSNATLTALRIQIENSKNILADDNVGISLQDMIKENRKIRYLELDEALGLYR